MHTAHSTKHAYTRTLTSTRGVRLPSAQPLRQDQDRDRCAEEAGGGGGEGEEGDRGVRAGAPVL